MENTSLPLSRFKVLDLTRVRGGPAAVRQLADWGADVIRIEAPERINVLDGYTGRRHSSDFQNLHRNKRAMTLDLKTEDGIGIFRSLVEGADVVVENYRPQVKDRLGIGYETLKGWNRRIVLASLSGFGQDGPYADRPGVDQIAQGMGGLMSVTGFPGEPVVRAGTAIADLGSGIYLAFGILAALLEREVSGEGQWVHTSLLEAMIALMDFQAVRWLIDREVPKPTGNSHPTGAATNMFPTKDGHVNIAAGQPQIWPRFAKALNAPELLERPELADPEKRRKNRSAVFDAIAHRTRQHSSAELVERLNEAGVPCGPIYTMDQVFADPQVRHLGIVRSVDHPTLGRIELAGQPIHMSRTPYSMRTATADIGQHTDEVLQELGLDDTAIADLHRRNVV